MHMESKYIGSTKDLTIADFQVLSVYKNTIFQETARWHYLGK